MLQILERELSRKIDKTLLAELLKEYKEILDNFYKQDTDKILSASGRFVEIVLATVLYLNDGKVLDLNHLSAEMLYQNIERLQLPKKTGEQELLYLEIPRVARAIYTIRSKKRGAHRKDLDPITQDGFFIKSASDWIMSSFIYLYHTKSDNDISKLISSIIEKKVPFIEEFEDKGIVILKNIDFKLKILAILYHRGNFLKKDELKKMSKPEYPQLLDTSLRALEKSNYIYVGENGIKITLLGANKIEKEF